jgi:cell division cycle 2-like protein
MGELILGQPLFPGQGDFDQLEKIVSTLGTPNEAQWPGLRTLPNFGKVVLRQAPPMLRWKFQTQYGGGASLTEAGFDLLSQLLAWDPAGRISAEEALRHRWFSENPLPCKQDLMPAFRPRKAD